MSQDAQMRRIMNQHGCAQIKDLLKEQNLTHLKALGRGDHLVIYSEEEGEKISQARLTRLSTHSYQLGFADHRGRWESTAFTGTIPELMQMLTTQFSWVLTDY